MGRAKYAKTISAHVPTSLIPSIDALCEKHGVSRSKILGYIVTAWYRAGCPSPTQLDTAFFERALHPGTAEPFPAEPTTPLLAAEDRGAYNTPTPSPDEILAERLNPRSRSATNQARASGSSASA